MSRARYVLDATALLCLFFQEPGADRVDAVLDAATMTAVNYAEVVAKLADRGVPLEAISQDLLDFDLTIVPVTRAIADLAARIGAGPFRSGLAVPDRLCLAFGKQQGATVLTVDKGWASIGALHGIAVEVLRSVEV